MWITPAPCLRATDGSSAAGNTIPEVPVLDRRRSSPPSRDRQIFTEPYDSRSEFSVKARTRISFSAEILPAGSEKYFATQFG